MGWRQQSQHPKKHTRNQSDSTGSISFGTISAPASGMKITVHSDTTESFTSPIVQQHTSRLGQVGDDQGRLYTWPKAEVDAGDLLIGKLVGGASEDSASASYEISRSMSRCSTVSSEVAVRGRAHTWQAGETTTKMLRALDTLDEDFQQYKDRDTALTSVIADRALDKSRQLLKEMALQGLLDEDEDENVEDAAMEDAARTDDAPQFFSDPSRYSLDPELLESSFGRSCSPSRMSTAPTTVTTQPMVPLDVIEEVAKLRRRICELEDYIRANGIASTMPLCSSEVHLHRSSSFFGGASPKSADSLMSTTTTHDPSSPTALVSGRVTLASSVSSLESSPMWRTSASGRGNAGVNLPLGTGCTTQAISSLPALGHPPRLVVTDLPTMATHVQLAMATMSAVSPVQHVLSYPQPTQSPQLVPRPVAVARTTTPHCVQQRDLTVPFAHAATSG